MLEVLNWRSCLGSTLQRCDSPPLKVQMCFGIEHCRRSTERSIEDLASGALLAITPFRRIKTELALATTTSIASSQPVIFAFHGYPTIVHKLTYKRTNHDNFHVHGFRERGTTTTPFDMTVRNRIDRYTLALDAVRSAPRLASRVVECEQKHSELMQRHRLYVSEYGEDMPEVRDWKWTPAQ
jgi:hypothetical protein